MVNASITGTLTTPGQYHALWQVNSGIAPAEANVYTPVPWSYLHSSRGSNLWDSTNKRFVLPVAGVWAIDFSVVFSTTVALTRMILQISVNGRGGRLQREQRLLDRWDKHERVYTRERE